MTLAMNERPIDVVHEYGPTSMRSPSLGTVASGVLDAVLELWVVVVKAEPDVTASDELSCRFKNWPKFAAVPVEVVEVDEVVLDVADEFDDVAVAFS